MTVIEHSLSKGGLEELLLLGRELAEGKDVLNTLSTELDVGSKVLDTLGLVQWRLDESGLNETRLAVEGSDERVGESGTSVTHREGSGTGTSLGLDDLVTTELDSLDQSLVLLALDVLAKGGLAQKGDNGDTRVTTNDGDVDVLGVGILDLTKESGSSDNVEGGNTEETLLVEDTGLLEDLSEDGDGGVDRVGDDEDVSLGAVLSDSLGEISDDRGVGVEQVVTGHSWLTGDTGRDDDNLGTGESGSNVGLLETLDVRDGVDVGDVGGDTWGTSDVVETEGGDQGVGLEEEGHRLTDTTWVSAPCAGDGPSIAKRHSTCFPIRQIWPSASHRAHRADK